MATEESKHEPELNTEIVDDEAMDAAAESDTQGRAPEDQADEAAVDAVIDANADAVVDAKADAGAEADIDADVDADPVVDAWAAVEHDAITIADWMTLERLLYAIILLIGGFLRFFSIEVQPLQMNEAAVSVLAWSSALGFDMRPGIAELADAMPPTSALLYSLQGILFWVVGSSDGIARFWPAVAGLGLVLLPWFVRHQIGRYTALILALLFAIDPWLGAYSRLVDGASLSAFLGLMVLCGLSVLVVAARSREHEQSMLADIGNWRNLIWVSAGLLLCSGPHAWSFVLVILLFVLLNGVPRELFATPEDSASVIDDENSESLFADLPVGIWLFVAALVLGATGWLAFPEGLSFVGTSVTTWIEQLVGSADSSLSDGGAGEEPMYSVGWLLLRLLVDQGLLVLLGLLGLVMLWGRRFANADEIESDGSTRPISGGSPLLRAEFLTLWTLLGAILAALPGRGPLSLLMIGLPLLLATAALLGNLAERFDADRQMRLTQPDSFTAPIPWREIRFVLLAISGLLVLAGFVWASMIESTVLSDTLLLTILLVLGIVLMLAIILALLVGWTTGLRVLGLYSGLLLIMLSISNGWHLNHRIEPLQPDALFAETTSRDVRSLVEDIRTLSAQRIGDPEEITIRAESQAIPDPVLAWNLRNMRNLTWSPSPAIEQDGGPIVLLTFDSSVTSQTASESYLGSDYSLSQQWLPRDLPTFDATTLDEELTLLEGIEQRWTAQVQPLARWVYYRKVSQMPPPEKVVLWTRGF